MPVAREKLQGLDRERVLAAVEPVLRAHNVEGVELIWGTDRGGRLLQLTIERPDSTVPGGGITIDLCSEISRDLSAALDVADVIPTSYRLEVGSPGVERSLYQPRDYERFAGRPAKLKLHEPLEGQRVFRGVLFGLGESGEVLLDTEQGMLRIPLGSIESARLLFELNSGGVSAGKAKGGPRRAAGRGRNVRRSRRSR